MNKADNLPMSAEEWHDKNEKMYLSIYHFSQEYANYLLSHHINVVAEKIDVVRNKLYDNLPKGELNAFDLISIISNHIKELDCVAKDYINELNLQSSN